MKRSKEIININLDISSSFNKLDEDVESIKTLFNEYYKKIKKEFLKELFEEKYILLQRIAEGENIDINILKSKYLKPTELINLNKNNNNKCVNNSNIQLLDYIKIKEEVFYYENKDNGKIFNKNSDEVGIFNKNNDNSNGIFNIKSKNINNETNNETNNEIYNLNNEDSEIIK